VQVRDERVAEREEVLRHPLVSVEVERPPLEHEQERGSLAPGQLDGPACADGVEAV
jgi:hypothetical protein